MLEVGEGGGYGWVTNNWDLLINGVFFDPSANYESIIVS